MAAAEDLRPRLRPTTSDVDADADERAGLLESVLPSGSLPTAGRAAEGEGPVSEDDELIDELNPVEEEEEEDAWRP